MFGKYAANTVFVHLGALGFQEGYMAAVALSEQLCGKGPQDGLQGAQEGAPEYCSETESFEELLEGMCSPVVEDLEGFWTYGYTPHEVLPNGQCLFVYWAVAKE